MSTKKATIRSEAKKLIRELNALSTAKPSPSPQTAVALISSLGPIYSWQKNKLKNLEFSLEKGRPEGFVTVSRDHEVNHEILHIKLKTLFVGSDDSPTTSLLDMLPSIESVFEAADDELDNDDDEINVDFRKQFEVCSNCGACDVKMFEE